MRTLLFLMLCCATSFGVWGQPNTPLTQKVLAAREKGQVFSKVEVFDQLGDVDPALREKVRAGKLLRLRTGALRNLRTARPDAIEMTFAAPDGKPLTVQLLRHQLLSDDFTTLTASGKNGAAYEPGLYFRGVVVGEERSLAAVSFFDDEVMAVFSTPEYGNLVLGVLPDDREGRYLLFRERDAVERPEFNCGAPELGGPVNPLEAAETALKNDGDNCVSVYLECDYDMYLEKGGLQNTLDHMTGLFNVVATLYQNENISTDISTIFVWDTPDDYPTGSTYDALVAFRNTRPSFNGDVAHLISRGAPAGGGIAWVNVLCSSFNYAYSYITSSYNQLPAYSWSVEVITHEMGHNLGSNHTHDCVWDVDGDGLNSEAIDGCGPAAGADGSGNCSDGPVPDAGTIMSYCHLGPGIDLMLGFGPLPGDRIRSRVAGASCLDACSPGADCNLSASATGSSVDCHGGATGSAVVTASGGATPYAYAWSNGAATATITGLIAGDYSVTVTDSEGCTATQSVSITQPEDLELMTAVTPVSDFDAGDGAIDLSVSGGKAPYAYQWSTGATSQDLLGLSPGVYTVTVTDAAGCQATESVTLSSNGCPGEVSEFPFFSGFEDNMGVWAQDLLDEGDWTRNSGATPTAGTGPNDAFEGGFYLYVEASEFIGKAFLLSPCLDLSGLYEPVLSFAYHMKGGQVGTLRIEASTDNGQNWVSIWSEARHQSGSWLFTQVPLSGVQSANTRLRIVGLTTGGSLGDIAIDALTVEGQQPPCEAPELSFSKVNPSCAGASDGSITATPDGGQPPYQYAWSNGLTSAAINDLAAGVYGLTVTDDAGCQTVGAATLLSPGPINVLLEITNETAFPGGDGAIDLTVTGGNGGFSYAWSDGATTRDRTNLTAGDYGVTVTDSKGCTGAGFGTVEVQQACSPVFSLPQTEDFETDLGDWSQSTQDDFDWTRYSGETPTRNTGPIDAADGDYFVYTEANENYNELALLESPCLDLTTAGAPTFTFSYHMYGSQMGALAVEVSLNAGASWEEIWVLSGNQGDVWHTASIDLSPYVGEIIKLRFAGVPGPVRSDMAIDAVSITDGGNAPAGLSPVGDDALQVSALYPNPASDWLTVVINSPESRRVTVLVFDQLGRSTPMGTVDLQPGANEVSLSLATLNAGLHFLALQHADGREVARFVVE